MLLGLDLLAPSKRVIGLSIEVVYDLVEQGAAKLKSLKVCSVRDSNPGLSESNDSLVYVASNPKGLEFFLTMNFDSL